jgi:hypothetical protein
MTRVQTLLFAAAVSAAAALSAAPAAAGQVSWQVNVSQPGMAVQVGQGPQVVGVAQPYPEYRHHHHGPRVVYAQPQVVYQAAPAYPAPVVMPARWEQPRVVVIREPVYVETRGHRHDRHCHGHHGHHGHHHGWDRD